MLESEGFDVFGTAGDGREALTEAARLRPNIVLLDIQLPDLDGSVADQLASEPGAPAVVLISSYDAVTYGPD